ncbi:carbohydrate ABC transporter permease [Clostridium sp. FS41]|uniref:carbohydrate ABC transporter permease n=1 Tax=Clostridia TaxID=186801 RepID=UPI0005D3FBF9|nr:carbohydrate ABC transporter permease [Clostridium sp. FS41]KJJ69715.1 L-arabinose transport system permease protein AraQ [Clostridium sp. FS41]
MKKKTKRTIWAYVILVVFGFIMVYPLIWMFFATFKDNKELFGTTALLPSSYSLDAYLKGWKGSGQYTFTTFFINSFKMVIPAVFFTIASCSIVAYGFARFKFVGKKLLFGLMISTLMLPNAAIIIPRYLLFRNLGWLNTFKPFWMPALLAAYPFFIFMLIQFLRGIPKDLDESAKIDGANSFVIFKSILLPLTKPALFSVGLMQFMWVWNDFYNPLIYINSVKNYPLALGVRMVLDTSGTVYWNQVLAMALVSILPLIILFFFAQRYFIEGIATTGMKG